MCGACVCSCGIGMTFLPSLPHFLPTEHSHSLCRHFGARNWATSHALCARVNVLLGSFAFEGNGRLTCGTIPATCLFKASDTLRLKLVSPPNTLSPPLPPKQGKAVVGWKRTIICCTNSSLASTVAHSTNPRLQQLRLRAVRKIGDHTPEMGLAFACVKFGRHGTGESTLTLDDNRYGVHRRAKGKRQFETRPRGRRMRFIDLIVPLPGKRSWKSSTDTGDRPLDRWWGQRSQQYSNNYPLHYTLKGNTTHTHTDMLGSMLRSTFL